VLAAVSVACTGNPPPSTGGIPAQPNQTTAFLQGFEEFQRTNTDPNKTVWWCHATGAGAHQHHESNGVEQGPATPTPQYNGLVRGNLSAAECRQNSESYDASLAYARQFPTLGDATRGGFSRVVQYLPGMGTHHSSLIRTFGPFNPRMPNTLQYAGDQANAPLIGMSWLVPGSAPPAGFAGRNDVWHQHRTLCYRGGIVVGEVIANNVTPARCTQLNGGNLTINLWMAHAWIVPNMQYQTDIHSGMHPCLITGGVAPAGHACWAQAQHDHSTGGEHHGEH
jgi:hypothetical protein